MRKLLKKVIPMQLGQLLKRVSLIAVLGYEMKWWNGKLNGTVIVHSEI